MGLPKSTIGAEKRDAAIKTAAKIVAAGAALKRGRVNR